MAHFHQRRRTRIRIQIRIPNHIITLYYAQFFPLAQIRIQIPVWIVYQMVTVPILGTDLRPRDSNPNLSLLVEMSHNSSAQGCVWADPPPPPHRQADTTPTPEMAPAAVGTYPTGRHFKTKGSFSCRYLIRVQNSSQNFKQLSRNYNSINCFSAMLPGSHHSLELTIQFLVIISLLTA